MNIAPEIPSLLKLRARLDYVQCTLRPGSDSQWSESSHLIRSIHSKMNQS